MSSTKKQPRSVLSSGSNEYTTTLLLSDEEEYYYDESLHNTYSYEDTESPVSPTVYYRKPGRKTKSSRNRTHLHQHPLNGSSVRDSTGLYRKHDPKVAKESISRGAKSIGMYSLFGYLFQKIFATQSQDTSLSATYSNAGVKLVSSEAVTEYKLGSSPSKLTQTTPQKPYYEDHFRQRPDKHYSKLSSGSPTPIRTHNNHNGALSPRSRRVKTLRRKTISAPKLKIKKTSNSLTRSEWIDVGVSDHNDEDDSENYLNAEKMEHLRLQKFDTLQYAPRGFHNDPSVPYTLSLYLQLLLNFLLSCIFIYFFYILVSTIRHDVDKKVEEYSSEILAEMAECSKQYLRNNCMPGRRPPALEKTCVLWEHCMNRDPTIVGRARVSAETFSEIINSFIKPLTFKTWSIIGGFIVASFVFSNTAFAFFRSSRFFNPSSNNNSINQSYHQIQHQNYQQYSGFVTPYTPNGYHPMASPPYGYFAPTVGLSTGSNGSSTRSSTRKKQTKVSSTSRFARKASPSPASSERIKNRSSSYY